MSEPIEYATPPAADAGACAPRLGRATLGGQLRAWLDRARRTSAVSTVGTHFGAFTLMALQGVLLARILGPAGRGEFAAAIFFAQTLTYIGLIGTSFSIARRANQAPQDSLPLARAGLRAGAMTGVGTMLLVALLSVAALPAEKWRLAPLCLLCSLALPWEHMRLNLLAVDHGTAAFGRYNRNLLFSAFVFPAALFALWTTGRASLTLIACLWVLVPVFGLAFRISHGGVANVVGSVAPRPRKLIREGLPYLLSVVASDLSDRVDIFLFLWMTSAADLGFYAVATAATSVLLVAPSALALFAFNTGAKIDARVGGKTLLGAMAGVALLQAVAALALLVALKPLMLFVFGREFQGAVPLAICLLPARAFDGCARVADGYLRGRKMPSVGIWARAIGAIVMAIGVFALFGAWRELAIPLAASAGHFVAAVLVAAVTARDVWRRNHRDRQREGEAA